jgi:hypothetical protein
MTERDSLERRRRAMAGHPPDLDRGDAASDAARGALAARSCRAIVSDRCEALVDRRDALLALARIRPAEAETLALFLGVLRSEPSAMLRWTAAMGLGRIGGPSAVRALERAASEDFVEAGVYADVPLTVADAAVAALSYLRSRRSTRYPLR